MGDDIKSSLTGQDFKLYACTVPIYYRGFLKTLSISPTTSI
jgi:hypothetical protein